MKLLPATREKLARDGHVVTHEVELPAGVHQARMVVRDVASGRIGSVIHRIDIPEPGSFRLSTPLVSDTLEPVLKGTPPVSFRSRGASSGQGAGSSCPSTCSAPRGETSPVGRACRWATRSSGRTARF